MHVYARFPDNASIPIIVDDNPDLALNYALTAVPNATYTVMAILELASAHRELEDAARRSVTTRAPSCTTRASS